MTSKSDDRAFCARCQRVRCLLAGAQVQRICLAALRRVTTLMLGCFLADVDEFYQQCDPDKENLCLYGKGLGHC